MAKNNKTKVIEQSNQTVGGGRWLVQEDGSRVRVEAPTKQVQNIKEKR